MQFSAKFVALVATTLMPMLTAAVQFTNNAPSNVNSGQQYTLNWNGDGTNAQIWLEGTPSGQSNLVPVAVLSSGTTANSLAVTIPNVPSGTYAFKIKQSGSKNVSPQFSISGTSGATLTALYGNNNNNNNNNNNGCDQNGNNCNNNNNNNNNGYTSVTSYVSNYGGTLSTSYSTTTYTTGTNNGCDQNGNNNCNNNNNGNGYNSVQTIVSNYGGTLSTSYSTTSYTTGASFITGVAQGCTTDCAPGVTQISDGQIQAVQTTGIINPLSTTTGSLTTFAPTATGTAGVVSFFGAAPRNAVGAGAALAAAGLAVVMAL